MSLNDSQWITETLENRTAFSVRYTRKLVDTKTDFQHMMIVETEALGRILVLDGCFMLTERDHFVYHEMIVHPAMSVLQKPRTVLIIGGGDGGAVTEVVKYPQVEKVILCELDPLVVLASKEFLPEVSAGLADPRVQIVHEDGARYVAAFENAFDLVIIDSTDPVGPGASLFTVPFYQSIRRSLKEGGIAVMQSEGPLFMPDEFQMCFANLDRAFGQEHVFPYLTVVCCYPGGLWSFAFCSETRHPLRDARETIPPEIQKNLRYYNARVHRAAFALPGYIQELRITAGS